MLAVPAPRNREASAQFVAQISRALFNLLRLEPPTGGAAAALLAEGLGGIVSRLLGCTCGEECSGAAREALLEAQLTALQLSVALPKELAFPPICGAWRGILDVLLPASEQAEGVEAWVHGCMGG